MEKNYITVKEFADLVGKSTASIYKRLREVDNQLTTYSTKVDNQIKIDISAVSEVYGIKGCEPCEPKLTTKSTKVDNLSEPESTERMLIETLQSELEIKNEQIKNLNEVVTKLTEQLETSNQMLIQQQQLHYISMGGTLNPNEVEPEEPLYDELSESEARENSAEQRKNKEKKGFFGWFRKK